jgi:hypothetical protein
MNPLVGVCHFKLELFWTSEIAIPGFDYNYKQNCSSKLLALVQYAGATQPTKNWKRQSRQSADMSVTFFCSTVSCL